MSDFNVDYFIKMVDKAIGNMTSFKAVEAVLLATTVLFGANILNSNIHTPKYETREYEILENKKQVVTARAYDGEILFIPEEKPLENSEIYHEVSHEEETNEVDLEYKEKVETVLSYTNIKSEEALEKFADQFIKYSSIKVESREQIIDMLYKLSQIPMEEKYASVLEDYQLYDYNNGVIDDYKFKVTEAIVYHEAKGKGTSYEDAFGVSSTLFNRINSKEDVRYTKYFFGEGTGNNIYYQAITPNQFEVYLKNIYVSALGDTTSDAYKAFIDMLYSRVPVHRNLDFLSAEYKSDSSIQLVNGGNNYSRELTDENRCNFENEEEVIILK